MIVHKTSVFPAKREVVFEKLQRLETLQTVAAPYASFTPVSDDADPVWQAGSVSSCRFKLFGIIPFGTHTIGIDNNLDRSRIQKLLTSLPSQKAFVSFSRKRQKDRTIKKHGRDGFCA